MSSPTGWSTSGCVRSRAMRLARRFQSHFRSGTYRGSSASTTLRASVGSGDYDAYLAVLPGETLADIYIEHGSRLLEGNVRTFLGRGSNVNKGIAQTVT